MRNFHNIESTKHKACNYYCGYGAGLVWHIVRTHYGMWRATPAGAQFGPALEAPTMAGISTLLDNAQDALARHDAAQR